jgi:hypothetical protein
MKSIYILSVTVAVLVTLAVTPAFAQVKGIGATVGGAVQTRGNVDVKAPAANFGVNTDASVATKAQTNSSTGIKSGNQGSVDVGAHLQSNPRLAAQVKSMLPSGSTVTDAATGFKDQGQFLAALHASQNLNIPFDQLKAHMTGSSSLSLGAAIKQERPGMDRHKADDEAKKAQKQAKDDGK